MPGTLRCHKEVTKSGGVDKSSQATTFLGVVFKPRHSKRVYIFVVVR